MGELSVDAVQQDQVLDEQEQFLAAPSQLAPDVLEDVEKVGGA